MQSKTFRGKMILEFYEKEVSGMQYKYDFEYMFPEVMEGVAEGALMGVAGIFMGVFLLIYFLAMAFSVASYVLSAVGMYRISKRRGIHHEWLAWIPVGNSWLLGSIADHYQYVAKQKVTKRRKVLLILNLVLLGVSFAFAGVAVGIIAMIDSMTGDAGFALAIALFILAYIVVLGLSIAIMVITYIAYYDLFRSSKPNNAVLFLVLGVLFNVTLPFFVFACGNHDEGMPAKRPHRPEPLPDEAPVTEPEEEAIPVVEAEVVEDPE